MLRVNIYLTEELNREIEQISRISDISKAEVVREALEKGLKKTQSKSKSAQALLDFAYTAEKLTSTGPKDLSENHDKYLYE